MLGAYIAAMTGLVLLVARLIAGYEVPDPMPALLLMLLEGVLLLTLSLFGSTLLPTLANGVVVFTLLGLAWLAGIIEFVGRLLAIGARLDRPATRMLNIGTTVSLLLPSDALWRGASYYLQSPSTLSRQLGTAPRGWHLLFVVSALLAASRALIVRGRLGYCGSSVLGGRGTRVSAPGDPAAVSHPRPVAQPSCIRGYRQLLPSGRRPEAALARASARLSSLAAPITHPSAQRTSRIRRATSHRGAARTVAGDVVGDLLHAVQHGRVIAIQQPPDLGRRQVRVLAQQVHRDLARHHDLLVARPALQIVDVHAEVARHGEQDRRSASRLGPTGPAPPGRAAPAPPARPSPAAACAARGPAADSGCPPARGCCSAPSGR